MKANKLKKTHNLQQFKKLQIKSNKFQPKNIKTGPKKFPKKAEQVQPFKRKHKKQKAKNITKTSTKINQINKI